jgi:Zn-finger nucleic acid-binding protein
MKCPVCNGVDLLLSERQGIEIDYCPNCRGVWLDRGELDKIIERTGPCAGPEVFSREQQSRQPEQQRHESHHPSYHDAPPRYQQQRGVPGHGHGHYHKKKKSFLSDIFDFD